MGADVHRVYLAIPAHHYTGKAILIMEPHEYAQNALNDLAAHAHKWDAIVCGGDHHAIALGMTVAIELMKPLMIVCQERHDCVISHITTIGDVTPSMRFLYVDDFYSFGATKAKTYEYFNQSEYANVVACYQATTREYRNHK
jgi:hypothetical protein